VGRTDRAGDSEQALPGRGWFLPRAIAGRAGWRPVVGVRDRLASVEAHAGADVLHDVHLRLVAIDGALFAWSHDRLMVHG
jgi:hypothetical protein